MTGSLYFIDGEVIAKSNDITIYEMGGVRYLEQGPGHNLWADSDEIHELAPQIGDRPFGRCLEIGLGIGVASEYILSLPYIDNLTTIEFSSDVVYLYHKLNKKNDKHIIVCQNGLDYMLETKDLFDFIFLDFYSLIDEDTLIEIETYVKASKRILNKGGNVMGWFDPSTPDEFVQKFFNLFDTLYIGD